MILQALCGYYERLAADPMSGVALPGWAVTPVTACITLDAEGNTAGVLSLADDKKKPMRMLTPQQPKRSSGVNPAFLCDNAGYFFGADEKSGEQKFKVSKALHNKILDGTEDKGALAVLRFFDKNSAMSPDAAELIGTGNTVFRLEGESDFVHNRPAVKAAWERHNGSAASPETGQCLVTGEIGPIARLHTSVVGFGQTKPTLVGFNQSSFKSYNLTRKGGDGKDSNGPNAPVSETAMFKYTTALNALLSDGRHLVRLADTKVVFWAERAAECEEDLFSFCVNGNAKDGDDKDDVRENDDKSAERIKGLLSAWMSGKNPDVIQGVDPAVTFHILGISASKARLVVRFFYSDTFGNILENIGRHYRDIAIYRAGTHADKELVSPWRILRETAVAGKNENIPHVLEGALLRGILNGTAYSYGLYNAILTRIRAESMLNHVRAGIIKGFLNRSLRLDNKEEDITMGLNTEEKNIAYRLGRMLAVCQKAQGEAIKEVNASVVDKFFNSALAAPQTVFPALLSLFEKHVNKLEKYGFRYKKLAQEIMDEIPSLGFPQTLNAEDQGRFIIGYYHQTQDFYKSKSEKTESETTDGGHESE
jgi:CRISPR-associated protein Csd1